MACAESKQRSLFVLRQRYTAVFVRFIGSPDSCDGAGWSPQVGTSMLTIRGLERLTVSFKESAILCASCPYSIIVPSVINQFGLQYTCVFAVYGAVERVDMR